MTRWIHLGKAIDENLLPDKPGVYILRLPYSIPRLLKRDPKGILLIGQTTKRTIQHRVRHFLLSAMARPSRSGRRRGHHIEGRRYYLLNLGEQVRDPRKLLVRGIPSENPLASEDRRLRAYQRKFGELPPLNSNGGVRPHDGDGKP